MSQHENVTENGLLLREKLKNIPIAMMTTLEEDGSLRSRPMVTQERDFDGDLWFFTQASAPKVAEVRHNAQINISYSKPEDNLFVSVSGNAQLVRDREKIHDMWSPLHKAWFPKGQDDPDLALLKVTVYSAEYWDAPSGKMGALYTVAKGLVTAGQETAGEHRKLDIK